MKVLLAVPTYGPVDPACSKDLRVAIMTASHHGVQWVGDHSPDRVSYSSARNATANFALANAAEMDGVMWVDSDIRQPADALLRLLVTAQKHGLDFVTGIYHSRAHPHLPVIYHWDAAVGKYLQCVDYPKDKIISLDACGFGFCYTSIACLTKMAESEHFNRLSGWFAYQLDSGGFSEDISFCHLAKKAGIQLYLDTGVQVGHTGEPHVIWEKDFRDLHITLESPEIQGRQTKPDWGKTT